MTDFNRRVTFDGNDEPLVGDSVYPHVVPDSDDELPQLPAKLQAIRDQMTAEQRLAAHIEAAKTRLALETMRKISIGTFGSVAPQDENQERGNWSNPIEFLLSSLGYVVGLGNIWRFPYLVYRNGGGAFFIPYLIMLALCGLPMVLMELTLGQYWAQGALTVWKLAPLFKGIGFSMILICILCNIYYCMITGWAMFYLAHSLTTRLPWACCEKEWCTKECVSFVQDQPMCNGGVQWGMLISLVIAWFVVFVVLAKGVKSLGKFSYVTSTLPYIVLLTLFIKALMQDGAVDGLKYYLTPQWSSLLSAQVWSDASIQIFYSTGVCFGCGITLASYNNRTHNVMRDAIILAIGNSCTSLFSGAVVFSILGFMAHSQNTTVGEVVTEGPGLTFIAYPQAVTLLQASPVWSTLFFVMLTTLALSSMFPMVENVCSAVIDQFSETLRDFKFWVTMVVCILSMLLGIFLTFEGGIYVLTLFDTYAVGKSLLFIGLAEVLTIGWVYGGSKLVSNLRFMIGPSCLFIVFKILWMFVTPGLLIFSIAFSLAQETPAKYLEYTFPPWAVAIGWCMIIMCILPIPTYAIYKFVSTKLRAGSSLSLKETWMVLTYPEEEKKSRAQIMTELPAKIAR